MPGSGIVCDNSSPVIMNCVLSNNGAGGGNGGGFRLIATSAVLLNCRVVNNGSASSLGGGLYAEGSSQPQVSHCTFSGNVRSANQGQIHARTGATLKLNNSTVWSAFTDAEIVAASPGTVTTSYSNVRGGASGVLNRAVDPLLETSGRLTVSSGSVDRGTTNSVAGYNWATRYDQDGEARPQIQPANILFSADIGSDEYVYRLQFDIVTPGPGVPDEDGKGRPKLNQAGQLVECDISGSEVDEASGVVFLGNDGSGRAIVAVLDDEQEEQFYIYTLNADGSAVARPRPVRRERWEGQLYPCHIARDAAQTLAVQHRPRGRSPRPTATGLRRSTARPVPRAERHPVRDPLGRYLLRRDGSRE
jgi:parallel beta-helix repeat protein